MFWAIGVLMVNAYIMYVAINTMTGKKKKELLSHHDFCASIALSWIADNVHDRPNTVLINGRLWNWNKGRVSPLQGHSQLQNRPKNGRTKMPPVLRSAARKKKNDVVCDDSSSTDTKEEVEVVVPKRRQQVVEEEEAVEACVFIKRQSFTDQALLGKGKAGILAQKRLDKTLDHLPVIPKGEEHMKPKRCQIHCWLGIETTKSTSFCPACNVTLCLRCYSPFHNIVDLVGLKDCME